METAASWLFTRACTAFETSSEGWKHVAHRSSLLGGVLLSKLPLRDGNQQQVKTFGDLRRLSKLPLRDGNSLITPLRTDSVAPFETSSEGWKPLSSSSWRRRRRTFETSSEGWKPLKFYREVLSQRSFETSSEGWKLMHSGPPRLSPGPFRNFL